MTANLEGPAAGARPPCADALVLRPFLDVCIGAAGPTLVEASRDAELVGLVEVKEGRVWRCIHQDHEGDRALRELLEECFDEIVVRRGAGTRNARNVFEAGLVENGSSADTDGCASPAAPQPAAGAAAVEADFGSLWDNGISALLERDLPRALESFRAAALLRPDDPSVRANLVRLRDMGFGGGE